ncbi:hypothetical protein ES703_00812 [subsurface metagenome]
MAEDFESIVKRIIQRTGIDRDELMQRIRQKHDQLAVTLTGAAEMVGKELGSGNKFKRYRKKPVIIRAMRMEKRFTVRTKEGKIYGKAGDYLVIGVKGEKYPVDKEIFEETFEEVA